MLAGPKLAVDGSTPLNGIVVIIAITQQRLLQRQMVF
jgi:hypothetical protein